MAGTEGMKAGSLTVSAATLGLLGFVGVSCRSSAVGSEDEAFGAAPHTSIVAGVCWTVELCDGINIGAFVVRTVPSFSFGAEQENDCEFGVVVDFIVGVCGAGFAISERCNEFGETARTDVFS